MVSHTQKLRKMNIKPMSQCHIHSKMNVKPISWYHMHSKMNIKPVSQYHMHSKMNIKPVSQYHIHSKMNVKPISWYHMHSKMNVKPISWYHMHSKMNIKPVTWYHMFSKMNINSVSWYHTHDYCLLNFTVKSLSLCRVKLFQLLLFLKSETKMTVYSASVDCHANVLPSTGHKNNLAQPKTDKCPSSTSHFSLFRCCLSVVLWLDI